MTGSTVSDLEREGFSQATKWEISGVGIKYDPFTAPGGLYAFVVGKEVKYIGKTEQAFANRLDNYRHDKDPQSQNARLRQLIKDELAAGREVKVFHKIDLSESAQLHEEELRLRQAFDPPWNIARW